MTVPGPSLPPGPPTGAPTSDVAAAVDHAGGDTGWRRLDRRMLIVQPLQAVGQFLPAIIVVLVAGGARDETPWWWNLAAVVAPIVVGVWAWYTTTYRITSEQLTLRQGIVVRKTFTARIDRTRTVDVTASPLQRILGLASVKVGTGTESPFVLPGLAAEDARALRTQLLHVAREEQAGGHGAGEGDVTGVGGAALTDGPEEATISRLSPSWIRFAPFTLTGLVAVLAAVGFLSQFVNDLGERVVDSELGHSAIDYVLGLTATALVAGGIVLGLGLVVFASVASYILRFWGYHLTRHARGTLGVSRGLLTTRLTTIEERRLRGVEIERPLLLRLVGGGRASALVTGLTGDETSGSASDLLVPPAPLTEVRRVAADVLGVSAPLETALRSHGGRARRRRHTRALTSGLLVTVPVAAAAWWFSLTPWLFGLAALPVLLAPLLAESRYRRLGHEVVAGHLVSRSGLFPETTTVVRTSAIIGWNITESFWQRRAGLVTLAATIAAGDDSVDILDLPLELVEAVVRCATPGVAEQFMERGDAGGTAAGATTTPARSGESVPAGT